MRTPRGHWVRGVGLALGVLVLASCASVTVRKVPVPTQYMQWTDEMQRRADAMEGLRFYLPRPFVNVFESFPVRTDVFLARGEVSADGKYVVLSEVERESRLYEYLATVDWEGGVPTRFIFSGAAVEPHARTPLGGLKDLTELLGRFAKVRDRVAQAEAAAVGLIGSGASGAGASTASGAGTTGAATAPGGSAAAPEQPVSPTGINERRVRNDNGAFAYQPLRGSFDIVYLPDFDEQYVVTSQAGLGNAKVQMNLGQGWSLQGFDSLVDNSELNRRIFDLIDTSIRIAKQAAGAFMGGIPGLAGAALGAVMPHEKAALEKAAPEPGTPVLLKIVVVHYAAKGLYPVIKPREVQERLRTKVNTYGFLDLFELFPKPVLATEFDQAALARAQQSLETQAGTFTVPRYPYQYVSFNTFRYMAIETVAPTTENTQPFKHLYDKTGTSGDVGAARTTEIDHLLVALLQFFRPQGTGSTDGQTGAPGGTVKVLTDAQRQAFAAVQKKWEEATKEACKLQSVTLALLDKPPVLEFSLPPVDAGKSAEVQNYLVGLCGKEPALAGVPVQAAQDTGTKKPAATAPSP